MSDSLLLGMAGTTPVNLLLPMANRHGLVAGATGTGKTVTLQSLAESFSRAGVPVFAADIKGDLSGIGTEGGGNEKVTARLEQLGLSAGWDITATPVVFWDVFGQQGHPVRMTVSEVGPLMMARLLELNDVQEGVLSVVFRVADDNGLLLLDLKDLRAMLAFVAENAEDVQREYGLVSDASVGAIQRSLLSLEDQGGDELFGEPALDLFDFMRTDSNGRGYVNLLASDRLMQSPRAYSTLLLWLLSELFERLPEAGDLDKPKLVFFFDEAHLLFDDAPAPLLNKIEQVVRLVRSKGVGIYFVTQNPIDIPDDVLGQLSNKVQHALRAFTPKDQKAVQAMAENFRVNPAIDVATAVTELGVGEALISVLDEKGSPTPVERAFIVPPHSRIGAISPETRAAAIAASTMAGKYDADIDRESAYEMLKARAAAEDAAAAAAAAPVAAAIPMAAPAAAPAQAAPAPAAEPAEAPAPKKAKKQIDTAAMAGGAAVAAGVAGSLMKAFGQSAVRAVGYQIGREISRGLLGSMTGKGSKRG
ncbi:MAG TPA: helicase HerA-like domain-containing protein [Coriobacteriia bacterium]|nr:helicase HerA-like domain-containing protein [Coriobacteriia bacterium]